MGKNEHRCEADHRPASRERPPGPTAHPAWRKLVPAKPHLSSSPPASAIVGKWKPLPITRQLEEKGLRSRICRSAFLKLFLDPIVLTEDKKKKKNQENPLSWRSWQLQIECNTVGKIRLLFPPTLTEELQVAYGSRLCMHIFSY